MIIHRYKGLRSATDHSRTGQYDHCPLNTEQYHLHHCLHLTLNEQWVRAEMARTQAYQQA